MVGGGGHTGGLTNPGPSAEDAEPVILIPVGLSKEGAFFEKAVVVLVTGGGCCLI